MKKLLMGVILLILLSCSSGNIQPSPEKFWIDGFARQTNVKTPSISDKKVKAKLNGEWSEFDLVKFPKEFLSWNKERRLNTIRQIRKMMLSHERGGLDLAGPHNGIVATTGFVRSDATFSLNNAVKGLGFLPKSSKIKEIINILDGTFDKSIEDKLAILDSLYINAEDIFAMDRQVSLELYSTSEYMTQTFLNQMYNPISTIVFLDMKSYKLKTIVRLLDPNDPNLTNYEIDVVRYVNLVHGYFHGKFSKDFITVIYFVNQIYDNSPKGRNSETGMGKRVVPLLP
jgi:hypothetical protein